MKKLLVALVLLIGLGIYGCEFKQNTSREEIPVIKESIAAFESVIRARSTVYLDSILSSDAAEKGTTAQSILDFVYGEGLTEFTGFTQKEILFRGDDARVDCKIAGPDGPTRDVTITLRKENEVWLIKKIEPRINDAIKNDSTGG